MTSRVPASSPARISVMRLLGWALAALLVSRSAAGADKLIQPFVGATFGTNNTFVDFEGVVGKPKIIYGATASVVGEIFGIDVDFADAPGFFSGDQTLQFGSRVTTLTGNVVIAAPRRLMEYTLRPYVTAGAGLLRVRIDDIPLPVAEIEPAMDVGGGIIGFITKRVGLCWELRRFQSLHSSTEPGISIGTTQAKLSFWRANMGLAFRY